MSPTPQAWPMREGAQRLNGRALAELVRVAFEAGRRAEREAIAAWLRHGPDDFACLADHIEDGEATR